MTKAGNYFELTLNSMNEIAGSDGPVRAILEERYYVYVLKLKDNRYYVGYTQNLKERIKWYENGYVSYTKPLRPLQLVTYISFCDKYNALDFEKYLKTGSGSAFMNKRLIGKEQI